MVTQITVQTEQENSHISDLLKVQTLDIKLPNNNNQNLAPSNDIDNKKNIDSLLIILCESFLSSKPIIDFVHIAHSFLEVAIPKEFLLADHSCNICKLKRFEEGVEYDSNKYEEAKLNFFLTLYFIGRADESIEIFIELNEDKQGQIYNKIQELFICAKLDSEKISEAKIKLCNLVISRDPKNYVAHFHKAWHLNALKRTEEAITAYKISLDIECSSNGLNNLGDIYKYSKAYQEAIDSYKKCIDTNPKHDYAWYSLGFCLYMLERYD